MNEIIINSESVLVSITSEHVKVGDTQMGEAFFKSIARHREMADHSKNRVELVFHGYNEDLRELYAIEEVRLYLEKLAENVDSLDLLQKPPSTVF